MNDKELADAWDAGYSAGINDEGSCEHRFGRTSRILWKLSGERLMAPWDKGMCHLYWTHNPHRPEIEDTDE